ncbi:ribose-5-phosphate isomerase RpiA [Paenibacillus sp. NEAU-GSW1]|uniref:ribose-5-phosphate isomerase RpiA n=1 Tax=Paenibacillus sp. NEAU-GSW1 TaxID=2682486 RepID=UPI0012E2B4D6|nr:ribose-5-phosphate isomerase RpiA [Paenibacillus sp. NEAU-GSW1]MUT65762.1 ribose-5-phosphate isomerase RpiA [Paenibacillus sp. NEAU-GSW1]
MTNAKQLVGEKAAQYVEDGMIVGLGTGSTVYWTIMKLGQMVQEGLQIQGVPTSKNTEKLATELGIPLLDFAETKGIDLAIDGADEVDPNFCLIKGGGGALLREKMIAAVSRRFIVVADNSKIVPVLGKFLLPVEVVPFGWQVTARQLAELGCRADLRMAGQAPFITDNGNLILDCDFGAIHDPKHLNIAINMIPGVVENGLFVGMTDHVIAGGEDGNLTERSYNR